MANNLTLGAAGLLAVAFCIQLGSLAALTNLTCISETSDAYINLSATADSYVGDMSDSVSGTRRRLLATPSASEYKARCSWYYALEWTSVFLLLLPVTLAVRGALKPEPLGARIRTGAFAIISVAWQTLILTFYSAQVATMGNVLRDAEVKDADYRDVLGTDKEKLWRSYQTYFAGLIIAVIAEFGLLSVLFTEDGGGSVEAENKAEATA